MYKNDLFFKNNLDFLIFLKKTYPIIVNFK